MKTTIEFLDACKERLDVERDSDLARLIGVSKQQISLLRSGRNCFGDETARRVAEVLEVEAAYVIACANAERTSSDEIRKIWVKVANAFATIALGVGLGTGIAPSLSEAADANSVYYVKSRRRDPLTAAAA